jgi:hypothetical protein
MMQSVPCPQLYYGAGGSKKNKTRTIQDGIASWLILLGITRTSGKQIMLEIGRQATARITSARTRNHLPD